MTTNPDTEKAPPDRLWLQWHGDADPELETGGEVSEGDVTWCRDKIFEHDIEYTRTSLSSTAARDDERGVWVERLKVVED